jgi:uncharacterized membrane protein
MSQLKMFIVACFIFAMTDTIWLSLIAKSMYFEHYASWFRLMNGELQLVWWAAVLVYVLFALGVVFLIFPLAQNNLYHAAAYGGLLGCIIYGVYNFTLIAIMKDWPIRMGFVDLTWGTFLYAWSATITLFISHRFFK